MSNQELHHRTFMAVFAMISGKADREDVVWVCHALGFDPQTTGALARVSESLADLRKEQRTCS